MATTPLRFPENVPDLIVDANNSIIAQPALTRRVVLTSAQLLALRATPQIVIPAPGVGFVIEVETVMLRYVFNSVAYTLNAGTIRAFYGPVANAVPLFANAAVGLIDQAANRSNVGLLALATGNLTDALGLNQPIFIANDGAAEFTLGNGTLQVTLVYTIFQAQP